MTGLRRIMKNFYISVLRIVVLGALSFLTAIPAHATFPGKNGKIAFIQDGEVFTMNPDGSDIKQITHLGPDNSANFPAWSADGKQIVFNEFPPPDGVPQIWAMNADGTNQHLVFAEQDFGENRPSLSPDGSKVVFGRCNLLVGDGDTCAIYSVGIDGTGLHGITGFQLDTTARSPMYSPDGKTVAFILSNDAAAGFLGVTYLVNADGSNMRRITQPEPCLIRPDLISASGIFPNGDEHAVILVPCFGNAAGCHSAREISGKSASKAVPLAASAIHPKLTHTDAIAGFRARRARRYTVTSHQQRPR